MQKVILDLLPGGVAPIVYASQYDDGRSIRFMLTEGGPDSQYSLNAGDVITCNLTKPDGTETVINVANPGGGEHYVDLVNGADDYDQAGAYLGEIVLTRNARVIGSANFVLKVEEDAYGGQITTLTATGNPCTFTTDLADALVSLTADIVCGGGGGTPATPIPLVPHSALNLDVNGDRFTVSFGQTVYGGVYDKSGRLTIEPINKVTLTGTENWSVFQSGSNSTAFYISGFKNDVRNTEYQYCSHFVYNQYAYQADAHENTFIQGNSGNLIIQVSNSLAPTVEDFKTWLATQYANGTPVEYTYNSTATPIVIDVPSISVFAEKGVNNIVSDCLGDVSVTYIKKV